MTYVNLEKTGTSIKCNVTISMFYVRKVYNIILVLNVISPANIIVKTSGKQ